MLSRLLCWIGSEIPRKVSKGALEQLNSGIYKNNDYMRHRINIYVISSAAVTNSAQTDTIFYLDLGFI